MSSFRQGYNRMLDNMGGIAGTLEAVEYSNNVQKAVEQATEALRDEASCRANFSLDYLKGWLAEQWHAETLKISGAARGRNDIWANVPGDNGPGDILFGNVTCLKQAQVKYYRTPEATAKAISRPDYGGMEKVVPGDQLEGVRRTAGTLADRNMMNRPDQAAQYQDTAERASDRLEVGDAFSKSLDEKHAKEMATDFRKYDEVERDKYGLNSESFVEWTDIAREAGQAFLHAAAMSAALQAAPHIWILTKEYIKTGQIDPVKLAERGQAILLGSATAGFRGGVAAGITAACRTGLLGEALQSVSPMAVGMTTTLTLNVIDYSIQLSQGRITNQEFAHHCMRDTFVLATGYLGGTVGQMIIPIPILGAMAGNLVGSTLGAVAFNGANQVILGICVESGWTFFGTVRQDYAVPEAVLRHAGYDLIDTRSFTVQSFSVESFCVQSFITNSLSFTPIRRGVLACNVVGYTRV